MKVTVTIPDPIPLPPTEVTITMTEIEARILTAFLGTFNRSMWVDRISEDEDMFPLPEGFKAEHIPHDMTHSLYGALYNTFQDLDNL